MKLHRLGLATIGLILGLQIAGAGTLTETYTTTATFGTNCTPGPKASTFLTTDGSVHLYTLVADAVVGDRLRIDWIRPDGVVYASGSHAALTGSGAYCFDDSIDIVGNSAAQSPGTWTIRGFWNGASFFNVTFTLKEPAAANTVSVLSTSDLFLSGHTGTQGMSSPGTAPPQISVSGSAGKAVRFTNVTGAWTCVGGGANNGPDGSSSCVSSSTNVASYRGVAGLTHSSRVMFLAGVFLDANEPADPAPARLDVSNYNAAVTLQPGLGQTFFIGDGLSAGGTLQEFIVPTGATRLYLGIVDGSGFSGNPCCYEDNSGSMSVTFEVVPPTQGGGGGNTCSLATATNLLGNGSFELPGTTATTTLISGTANATLLPCWTVTSGNLDYIGTLWAASDGNNSLDMDGLTAGAITQTFATTAGSPYTVSFDLAANPGGGNQNKILEVSAAGQSQTFPVNPTVNPASSTGWLRGRTFTFTANSASTTLQFTSLDGTGSNAGPALDNVCAIAGASPCTGGGGGGGGGSTILSISLAPSTASSASGLQHTVTATVVDQNNTPQANVAVTFTILSGPNQGATGICGPTTCKTGANGQVTFTYTGTRGAGVDSITACIDTGTVTQSDCCTPQGVSVLSKTDSTSPATAEKRSAAKSTKVVIIGAATVDANCASGANRIQNGGCLPVSGAAAEIGAFTFAGLAPASVTAANLAQYDTAVLNVDASGIVCDMTKLSAQAKSDLVSFVGSGKKLIIYDSECEGPANKGMDYSWLPFPFTTANPGALGAQGTLNIVENSTLGSSITGSPYYIDAANLSNNTDAVGDMNVMTTKDAHWCLAMSGTNALKVTGPVHAYAKYPGGTDSGLFIYNGLDMDELNNVGNANLRKIWFLELQQAFNPSALPCGVAVVGITTSVNTATPAVGSQVTFTARVVDQLGQPQANIPVTFTVTGVNGNVTGVCSPSTCRTDSNGQVTFTYPGTKGAGSDSLQACFTPSGSTTAVCAAPVTITWGQGGGGPACATPVTKTWTAGGPVCNYFVQPLTNVAVPAAGTRNGFLQIFTGLQCKWGAVSNDSWITIIAGASGTGSPGAVSYSVAPNTTSSPRTGTISITDGSGTVVQTHTVIQRPGGPPCTFGISPLSGGSPASGGGGAFLLTTGSGCYWIAVPNDPWIHVTPNSGYGSQLLNYNGDANPTTSGRIGTIGVMGQTFTVFQGAPAPPVPPGTPTISSGGIVNAASSRGGPIARGSFFTIYGTDIGPAVPAQATSYPIPDTMGNVVVTISQGSITKRAYLHFVSSSQVNGIVPSDAPLGDVQVTVTFNGKVGVSSTATLVDTSFGIFSAGSGIGPGIIQNWNSPTDVVLNLPTIPAKPQQLGILWGTGLGPVNIADNNKPPVGDLPAPVIVEVAGITAQLIYHGRAPDFAGVDNVYFYVPQGVPEGCSVPVRVKAGPTWSNTVRMAIRGGTGQCQDPANPNSTLSSTGGKIGAVIMMRAELNGQFQANQAPASATLDIGAAIFAEVKAGGQLAFSGALNLPPAGSCASNTKALDFTSLLGGDILGSADTTVGRQLDAGSKVTITGSKGSVDLNPLGSNAGTYMGLLGGTAPLAGAASTPLFLDPKSSITISSSGGKDVGPISGSITLPSAITWTNRDQIITVNRSTPLTITWTGGDPGQMMVVAGGAADSKTKTSGGFFCLVPVGPGTFTVPVSILADLPTTRPLTGGSDDSFGGIGLLSVPQGLPPTFNATGLDTRIIMTGSASIKTVQIQ